MENRIYILNKQTVTPRASMVTKAWCRVATERSENKLPYSPKQKENKNNIHNNYITKALKPNPTQHVTSPHDYAPESLVEHDTHEDVRLHDFAREAVVQRLGPVVVEPAGPQLLPHVVDDLLFLVEAEGGRVLEGAVHCTRLASHGLYQHTCVAHSTREPHTHGGAVDN
jgi:hypothetical protein